MNNHNLNKPILFPRGIAAPSGQAAYIRNAVGGIDAIDLTAGKLMWSTDVASRPLFVFENRLAAQRLIKSRPNVFEVAILDLVQDGTLVIKSDPIELPDWVSITSVNEQAFSLEVYTDKTDLILAWRASVRYEGGAPPSQHILEQEERDAEGTIRVSLESGRVEIIPQEEKLIASSTDELQNTTSLSNVTLNGRYLCIPEEQHPESSSSEKQNWSIFSIDTGNNIAQLSFEANAQEICILASNLYYITTTRDESTIEYTLKARNLTSGKLLWERLLDERRLSKPPPLPK